MNLLKILLTCIVFLYFFLSSHTHAAINFTVTPLKYDIEVNPGETITRVAQIRNNGTGSVVLTTGASDFQANGLSGVPSFVRKSELVYPDQQLSSWIDINVPSLSLNPGEQKSIIFTIDVPTDATPGGHYGAVFFKNPNSESGGGEIAINVDYGVLLIVNVSGEVIVDIEVEPVVISGGGGGGWGGGSSGETKDICPLGDFTKSKYDGKCIGIGSTGDTPEDGVESGETNPDFTLDEDGNTDESNTPSIETFEVSFQIPISNKGNTHVQPTGKIKLIDEDGNEIKGIGKEVKKNDYGAVIGEEIVDYLPLNDEGGNVLPKTKRNFETIWKGFPYKEFDERGNPVIKYWKPGDYYTMKNMPDNQFMMPWETVKERVKTKKIEAIIELVHQDENGNDVVYESAKEFDIEYKEQYIGINWYIVFPLFIIIGIWLIFWFIVAKRKKICVNKDCEKKIKRKEKICPYCSVVQQGEDTGKKVKLVKKTKNTNTRKKEKKSDDTKKKKKKK